MVYCDILCVLWYTGKCARISKKEEVALCWISSECEVSFLSSGSLMGSCREEEKGGRGEWEEKREREEDKGTGEDSQFFKTHTQLSQGAYPCECPEFIGVFSLECPPGECA